MQLLLLTKKLDYVLPLIELTMELLSKPETIYADREGYLIPTTGEAHRYVSDQFDLSPDPVRQLVAEDLVKLRLYRRQADYVDTFPGLLGITKTAIRLSEEVISTLNNL